MLLNDVRELVRIRNLLADKDRLIRHKDIHTLNDLIMLPEDCNNVYEILNICDEEIKMLKLCLQ